METYYFSRSFRVLRFPRKTSDCLGSDPSEVIILTLNNKFSDILNIRLSHETAGTVVFIYHPYWYGLHGLTSPLYSSQCKYRRTPVTIIGYQTLVVYSDKRGPIPWSSYDLKIKIHLLLNLSYSHIQNIIYIDKHPPHMADVFKSDAYLWMYVKMLFQEIFIGKWRFVHASVWFIYAQFELIADKFSWRLLWLAS